MGKRVLVTGLSTFWGGRVAHALESDPGVDVIVGHQRAIVHGCDAVTASTAIPARNVELDEARQQGITVLRRAGMLASICARARSVERESQIHRRGRDRGFGDLDFVEAGKAAYSRFGQRDGCVARA